MRRLMGTVVGLALVVLVLCVPAFGFSNGEVTPNTEDTTITDYRADFTVDEDGDLAVTETLAVDFPKPGKHGIFRFWDEIDDNAPHARRTPQDISVTLDGEDEPFELSTEEYRFRVAKVGDADTTIEPGVHTYVLTYRIDGVLDANDDALTGQGGDSMFYWNLIPQGWQQEITHAELTVHLPVAAQQDVRCAIGNGETDGCTVEGGGTQDLTITAAGIAARTPLTIATALDVDTPADVDAVPWTGRWDPVLGKHLWLLALVLVLAALATAYGVVLGARSREEEPAFPLLYAPPEGIGPAQAKYVYSEDVDKSTYVASLMYAAEKGAVDLTRDEGAWTITDKSGAPGWAGLDPVTTDLAHILGGPGSAFTATTHDVEAGKRLKSEIDRFEKSVEGWAEKSGILAKAGLGCAGGLLVVAGFVLALAFAIFNPFNMSLVGLIPGGFAVAAVSLVRTGAATRRTRAGRDLWSRVGGFRRVLATPSSKDRFDFSGREELYTAYIPWAVALDCAEEWAGKFRIETGQEPPVPHYFAGAYAGGAAGAYVDSMVDSFSETVDGAISSYDATQSSSSSSSGGGGGFSGGGGGGGGGGGSW